ncbi:hypothetical protein ACLK1Z_20230 [Escherichia coli]
MVQATESWVKTPMRQTPFPGIVPDETIARQKPINADLFRCDGGGDWLPVAV